MLRLAKEEGRLSEGKVDHVYFVCISMRVVKFADYCYFETLYVFADVAVWRTCEYQC